MKNYILLFFLILFSSQNSFAQWQLLTTPIFTDNSGQCNDRSGVEPASDSVAYWGLNVSCGIGSGYYSYYRIHKTTNYGTSWGLFNEGDYPAAAFRGVNFISKDTGYIVINNQALGFVYRTSDGMNTFQGCNYTIMPAFTSIKMLGLNDMYAIDQYRNLQHLDNDTFKIIQTLPATLSFFYSNIEVTKNRSLYLTCKTSLSSTFANDCILRSFDGGLTWDSCYISSTRHINYVKFISDNIGFAICDSGIILKTTNAGNSWSRSSADANTNLTCIDFMNDLTGIIVGDSGTILKTTDGGASWSSQLSPTSSRLVKVKFPERDSLLTIQTNSVLWKAKISDLISAAEQRITSLEFTLFPNPTNGDFSLTSLHILAGLTLEIYNILGEKVLEETLSSNLKTHTVSFHSSKGIYLIRINNGYNFYTQKLILR